MLGKAIKIILLILLVLFYVRNITNTNDWVAAVLYNRVNFIVLVAILYLAACFVSPLGVICFLVLVGGLFFHGYMYYNVYKSSAEAEDAQMSAVERCHGNKSTWYSKLNDSCY